MTPQHPLKATLERQKAHETKLAEQRAAAERQKQQVEQATHARWPQTSADIAAEVAAANAQFREAGAPYAFTLRNENTDVHTVAVCSLKLRAPHNDKSFVDSKNTVNKLGSINLDCLAQDGGSTVSTSKHYDIDKAKPSDRQTLLTFLYEQLLPYELQKTR